MGIPPPIEVSITNLNDNINKDFLEDLVKKFGPLEEVTIYYHPRTKKHLGLAKLIFESPKGAKACVDKLHNTSVMGKVMSVFLDPLGREITKAYETAVNPPPPLPPAPTVVAKPAPPILAAGNLTQQSVVAGMPHQQQPPLLPDGSSTALPPVDPILAGHHPPPHIVQYGSHHHPPHHTFVSMEYSSYSSYDNVSWSNYSNANSSASHGRDGKTGSSPTRESLDQRIENLFKLRQGNNDHGGITGSAPFDLTQFKHDPKLLSDPFNRMSLHNDNYRHHNYHHHRSHYHGGYRKSRRRKGKLDILSTPPSPFANSSEYLRCARITRAIQLGVNPEDYDSQDDYEDDDDYGSGGDGTPVRDEPSSRWRSGRTSRNRNRRYRDGDDRLSDSSSSSPERGGRRKERSRERPSSRTTSAPIHHPMYPSEHLQELAKLGIWKPGMGSGRYMNQSYHEPRSSFSHHHTSSYPHGGGRREDDYYNHHRSHRESYSSYHRDDRDRLPSDYDIYRDGREGRYSSAHRSGSRSYIHRSRTLEERESDLVTDVIDAVLSELKEIINRDIKKKMIESTGFRSFESWWDDCESRQKMKSKEMLERSSSITVKDSINNSNLTISSTISTSVVSSSTAKIDDVWSSIQNSLKEKIPTSTPTAPFSGLGLGLGRLIPKIPSFRRKFKAPSPVPEDDDDDWEEKEKPSSDHEGDQEEENKKHVSGDEDPSGRVQQKNRAAAVIEDSLSSSSSDEDERPLKKTISSSDEKSLSDSTSSSSSESSLSDSSSSEESDSDFPIRKTKRKKKTSVKNRRKTIFSSSSEDEEETKDLKEAKKSPSTSLGEDEKIAEDDCNPPPQPSMEVDDEDSQMAAHALMALASGFASKSESQDKEGSDTDSAPETQELPEELRKPITPIDFDHPYALPTVPKSSAIDSTIDEVIRATAQVKTTGKGKKQLVEKKETGKKIPKKKPQLALMTSETDDSLITPIASEWRKAKGKKAVVLSDYDVDRSPVRIKTPRPTYLKRSVMEEMDILYDFLRMGIDDEDIGYLKRSYHQMLQEESNPWLHDTQWVDHPATFIPVPKKRKKQDEGRVHVTGCARSEGYYKMDIQEKRQHSHVANAGKTGEEMEGDKPLRARGAIASSTTSSTREARSNQRRLLATVDAAWSDLLKFNQLQVSGILCDHARDNVSISSCNYVMRSI